MTLHLPADRALNDRISLTGLRHYANCPRSGYLYAKYKGEARTDRMVAGSAFHEVADRAVRLCIAQEETKAPPEIGKAIVNEVLMEYPVRVEDHDRIREMAHRFLAEWEVDPQSVVACETLFVVELAGWQVRCRIDYASVNGERCEIRDYKTSRAAPSYEDISRKRPDGSRAAKNMQLIMYAVAMAYGKPVRIEDCGPCHGTGYLREIDMRGMDAQQGDAALVAAQEAGNPPCKYCDGQGYVEHVEPFGVADRAQTFDMEFVYPAIDIDGKMLRRGVSLTRLELGEYRDSIATVLHRLRQSEAEGDWPAVVSEAACSECPAEGECPIPRSVRSPVDEVVSEDQAREESEAWHRIKAEQTARRAAIKKWVKANGESLRFGADKEWRFVPVTRKRTGEDGSVTEGTGTDFKDVTLSSEELESLTPEMAQERP